MSWRKSDYEVGIDAHKGAYSMCRLFVGKRMMMDGRDVVAEEWLTPGGVVKIKEGEFIPSLCDVDDASVQRIMDSLWGAGYRPSLGVASAGQAEAQAEHIKDLRSFVDRMFDLIHRSAK